MARANLNDDRTFRIKVRAVAAFYVLEPREEDEHQGLVYIIDPRSSRPRVTAISGNARKAIRLLLEAYVEEGPGTTSHGYRVTPVRNASFVVRNRLFPGIGAGQSDLFTAEELAEANAWQRANGGRDVDWFALAIAYFRSAIGEAERIVGDQVLEERKPAAA